MESFYDPDEVAESDQARSEYIRHLVHRTAPSRTSEPAKDIPRVLVQFWHDLDNIPADVEECLNTWMALEQYGFERLLFDDNKVKAFISSNFGHLHVAAFELCRHPAMRCDYFRLCYLLSRGGWYVDADEVYQGTKCERLFRDNRLKVQPLCYDTSVDMIVSPDDFVRNRKYSNHWIFYVNNNPIISPPDHPILRLALERATRLLLSPATADRDIQSITGPGNLTASLVRHSISCEREDKGQDFVLIPDWQTISISRWPLSYRDDERNWRIWSKG